MKKVAVIGCPGSGKSTLATKLANKTGLPIYFLDEVYHDSSKWSTDNAEKKQQWRTYQEGLVQNPEWIIDGNYKGTLEIRVAAADSVIFLDYPRWLCLFRVTSRTFKWHMGARKLAGGNPGKTDMKFLRFIWSYKSIERPKVIELLRKYEKDKEVIILTSPRQAKFLGF